MGDKVKLGRKYRDRVTGFEGVATGRFEYQYGCVRIMLEATELRDGKSVDATFDEQRLLEVPSERPVRPTATSGGPCTAPSRPSPTR
jgi:hypothetical protein